MTSTKLFKELLGDLPYTAELYWLLRNRDGKAFSRFNLENLKTRLPGLVAEVRKVARSTEGGKKVFLFASMHFWINHLVVSGLALRGMGYDVSLGYLPYSDFTKPVSIFDLRRNDLYAQAVLQKVEGLIKVMPFLGIKPTKELPEALTRAVEQITTFDTRYILQTEEINGTEPIYQLRRDRNVAASCRALTCLRENRPDVVILPNGMIQEYGAIYETAKFLGIPSVTYEFGEQDQRIWLGQDRWVIHHQIDELWNARKDRILSAHQRAWLTNFLGGREKQAVGDEFAHLWQKTDRAGGERIRQVLGLNDHPVVLIPTNVLGDSATLGLTVFSRSMTEWLERVVQFLALRPEFQVLIRIHPGETLTEGPSVRDIIQRVLPEFPAHFHLISAREKINTYDLMEVTDLALVYTTTAGLEMALRGIPVLVSGRAHYRGKGFTLQAETWIEYQSVLEAALHQMPARLAPEKLEKAWNYAYTFFAEYPLPFPWHLEKLWPSLDERPLAQVLNEEGQIKYGDTFRRLAGESRNSQP